MLADRVRYAAFREAFAQTIVPGRTTVADIGAGTGILAFLARELGAREVWLYEPEPVLLLAQHIAAANGVVGLQFVPEFSLDVRRPVQVDLVVAEVLGNFAYEEGMLETLRDAHRFLAPGGTLIPQSIVQWAAPVTSSRFDTDFRTWRDVGVAVDFTAAEQLSRNNMYVFQIEPADLGGAPSATWDALSFVDGDAITSRRAGCAAFEVTSAATVYGFALWWECTLVPGVVLSTSPLAPRTHWDQIYMPLAAPLPVQPADQLALAIETETGGEEPGIAVAWTVAQRRAGTLLAEQRLSLAAGQLS